MKAAIVILFFLGIVSAMFLGVWFLSLILYGFGDSVYQGAIAFVPKWIFLFFPLVFLGETKPVDDFLEKIVNII